MYLGLRSRTAAVGYVPGEGLQASRCPADLPKRRELAASAGAQETPSSRQAHLCAVRSLPCPPVPQDRAISLFHAG